MNIITKLQEDNNQMEVGLLHLEASYQKLMEKVNSKEDKTELYINLNAKIEDLNKHVDFMQNENM